MFQFKEERQEGLGWIIKLSPAKGNWIGVVFVLKTRIWDAHLKKLIVRL